MANVYQTDPYNGWVANGSSNLTAHELMGGTSGAWRCVFYSRYFRVYVPNA